MRLIIFASLLIFSALKVWAEPLNFTSVEIAQWKGNAAAAYSIIHDDACGAGNYGIHRNADTVASNRGLVIGVGAIVQNCVDLASTADSTIWQELEEMVQNGHEMISHSWLHDDATFGLWGEQKDVIDSKATLEQNISGCSVTFFVFPYDNYNDSALNQLRNNGYLGARAGIEPKLDRGVNTVFTGFDPFRSNFDAFCLTESASIYTAAVGNANTLQAYLDDAVSKGGWALQEMHEVGSGTLWGYIRVPEYEAHMDYVQSKVEAGQVWNATPTNVVKYIVTKDQCGTPVVSDNVLSFSSPDSVDPRYAVELTILLSTVNDPVEVSASQNGEDIPVDKLGAGSFSFDVDPTKGDVVLSGPSGVSFGNDTKQRSRWFSCNKKAITCFLPRGSYRIDLYSLQGRKISTLAFGYSQGSVIAIPLQKDVAEGMYCVTLTARGRSFSHKIVISR